MLLIDCQPDAHLAAEEEAKRLEELQKQAAQERLEQFEKAHVRGFQAMKKIHLAQVRIKFYLYLLRLTDNFAELINEWAQSRGCEKCSVYYLFL